MSSYAIIKTGGKQYRVQSGDVIDVELLQDHKDGKVEFKDILVMHDGKKAKVGSPSIAKAFVRAEIVNEVRGPKVIAYKYKQRKNNRRKVGHRQNYMRVKITELSA